MNIDDSFNDSDEMISLYSSKNIKETFKAQLRKIISDSRNQSTNTNSEGACNGNPNDFETQDQQQKDTASSPESPGRTVESSTPKSSAEDSIELVSDFTPVRKTRQSERLRKEREKSIIEVNALDETPPNKQAKSSKRGRKSRNNKKNNKVPPEVIVLDESEEAESADSEEDINPEVSVKIIWKSVSVKKFQIRKFQKFSKIFEQLSKEESVPEDKIMLTFNNTKVRKNDTPDSLNLKVYHFIDGGVLSELTNSYESDSVSLVIGDKISVKFQDNNKKIVKVKIDRKDKMKVGMIKCSEQLEIPLEKIKFFFDGEIVEPSQTPECLGLENDEIIDIKISN